MRTYLLLFSVFLCTAGVTGTSYAEINRTSQKADARLSLLALQAAKVALSTFEKEQPNADPKSFYVVIREMNDFIEVDFVPNPVPVKEGYNGDTPYIEVQSGGGNVNGREIRYTLSKNNIRVLRKTYSR